ncbi:hypothetical protein DM02DRAFT_692972 [Periconia macrospinosa]|uniref:Uncharacterized protein n=1 Tax=Periconia macrospinosa TaxID=97972 RepID=A0A2V1D8Q3_9PLEO|nr:hypothetical protein DM02DRAFT_692972 [Periconia macrospinosa]
MAAPSYRDTILTPTEPETERLFHCDDESNPVPESGHVAKGPPKYLPLRFLLLLWKSCVLLLALYGLLGLWQRMNDHSALVKQDASCSSGMSVAGKMDPAPVKQDASCSCGTSVAEAMAKGCQYDILSSAWLPPRCRDEKLSAQFDKAGPGPGGAWSYFADLNGTTLIDPSTLSQLTNTGRTYYATNTWHIVHCFYFWKKQYRAKFTGVTVEAWGDTEPHIDHCLKTFRSFAWTESMGSTIEPMLPNPPFRVKNNGKGDT